MWRARPWAEMNKRTSARIGALTYIALFVVLLAVTTTMGWCDGERFERRSVMGWPYARTRSTMCGFVRGVAGEAVDSVPCQVWNLAPLTLVAGFSAWWLVGDLTGLRRYEEKPKRRKRRDSPRDD
jgi:hypothetical protein